MKKLFFIPVFIIIFSGFSFSQILKDTVADADGNVYHMVKIGNQIWMTDFLKTTKFSDGKIIPNVPDSSDWSNLTTAAYCDYYNRSENVANYGRLYNWFAADNSSKICPLGWHVPNFSEWLTLDSCLKTNNNTWEEKGWWSYLLHGQSQLPIDHRSKKGLFINENSMLHSDYGGWWTSTEADNSLNAWRWYVGFSSYALISDMLDKKTGLCIICIKD